MTSKQHDFSMVFHSLKIGGIFTQIHVYHSVTNGLESMSIEIMPMDNKIFEPSWRDFGIHNRYT